MKFEKNNSGDYRLTKKRTGEQVRLDLLDNFTKKMNKKNSLIFVDAQGHEPEIFIGGKKTLKKKIPIVFELMPSIMNIKNPGNRKSKTREPYLTHHISNRSIRAIDRRDRAR